MINIIERNEIERSLFSDEFNKDVMLNWQMSMLKADEKKIGKVILKDRNFVNLKFALLI